MLKPLRRYASDPRWRIQEGVCMALERLGEKDMDRLSEEMGRWSRGNLLEKRLTRMDAQWMESCKARLGMG